MNNELDSLPFCNTLILIFLKAINITLPYLINVSLNRLYVCIMSPRRRTCSIMKNMVAS